MYSEGASGSHKLKTIPGPLLGAFYLYMFSYSSLFEFFSLTVFRQYLKNKFKFSALGKTPLFQNFKAVLKTYDP